MKNTTVKQLSYVAFGLGISSVILSGATYLIGKKDADNNEKSAGHFIGLWAPTFFLLAEMLDRVSIEDESYLGVAIERGLVGEIKDRARELVTR